MTNNDVSTQVREQESGSFLVGFLFGLFAGALSVMLFKSKKGQSSWKKIQKHWNQAKENLPTDTGFSGWQELLESMLGSLVPEETVKSKTSTRKKPAHRKKKKTKKLT